MVNVVHSKLVIPVIVNAHAGAGDASGWANQLAAKFEASGMQAKIILARSGNEMTGAAHEAVRQGASIVVAGGGDGTINAIASILAGSRTALGVLPLGTLNHFAKDLDIPLDLDEAIKAIADGNRISVDVADVNGKLFLNNSSLGLYPDIVHDRETQQQRLGRGKWPAFFLAALSSLRRYPFLTARLTINGKELLRFTPFVFVGNNKYTMEGLEIGSRERLDDGMLSLYIAQRPGRLGLLRLAFRALTKRLSQAKDFDTFLSHEIRIETRRRRLRVSTDGEVNVMETPLTYRILPAALQVVVRRESGSTG